MSNYLSRVVSKSFSMTELIQPRLASLFEPPAPGGHVFEIQNPSEQLNAAAESDRIRTDAPQPFQPESISTKNTLESQHTDADLLITNTPIHNSLDHTIERLEPRSARLINRTSLSKQVAQQPDNSVLQTAHDQPTSNSIIMDRHKSYDILPQEISGKSRDTKPEQDIRSISVKLSSSSKPQVTELPSSIIALAKTDHDFPEPASTRKSGEIKSEQVVSPISIKRAATPVNTVSQPISQILHSGPAKVVTEPTGPAVIHVTIGSIEVRAIKAPEQIPQHRTRPGPRLSLDDYLRSRKGDRL